MLAILAPEGLSKRRYVCFPSLYLENTLPMSSWARVRGALRPNVFEQELAKPSRCRPNFQMEQAIPRDAPAGRRWRYRSHLFRGEAESTPTANLNRNQSSF
jgi:hypothetical protein